jgi:branched-chain amino acid transport system permease protein
MHTLIQVTIIGLGVGCVYGLVSLGFVVLFKSTGVFNFAQGSFVLMGAYFMVTCVNDFHLAIGVAAVVVLVASLLVGALVHQLVIKRMTGQPMLPVVMLTIGLTLIIGAILSLFYGSQDYYVRSSLSSRNASFAGFYVPVSLIVVVVSSIAATAVFGLLFRNTRVGLHMRATAEDHEAAVVVGINVDMVQMVAWALSAALAAAGGILLANIETVNSTLSDIGLLSFPAAVIGGLTSIPGAIVGGLLVGVVELLGQTYVSSSAGDVTVYIVLIVILIIRPFGLLGSREVNRV